MIFKNKCSQFLEHFSSMEKSDICGVCKMDNKDEFNMISVYINKRYKSLETFKALKYCWNKSNSPMKKIMIEMLNESIKEIEEIARLEKEFEKELKEAA